MDDLFFFDADCRVGSGPVIGIQPGVKELLAEMDHFGIDKAVIQHGSTGMLGAAQANLQIAEMLKEDTEERLTGIWYFLPTQCRELPEPDEFFRQMKENRIRLLALNPYEHQFIPHRISIGKIMDAAKERNIPIFLREFSGQWRDLYDFIERFPENTFIYCDRVGKWGHDRKIRPLLENYSRFYYGMSGYWVPEGIRDLADAYGADRLLYSSGFPYYIQGSGMTKLKFCGLNEKEIAAIAGKNLEKILSEVQL